MPMAVEFMGSEGEPTTAALLNGYIFEEPSKYLCLYLGSVLLLWSEKFLCVVVSSQHRTHN